MQSFDADIAIIGGGLNGAAMAVAAASSGLSVVVVDAFARDVRANEAFDGRATAIAAAPRLMLKALDLWDALDADAQPINDILVTDGRVSEGAGSAFLHFDHAEIGDEPFGWLCENRHLRHVLFGALEKSNLIELRAPVRVARLERTASAAVLHLEDRAKITARLAIACDGRRSRTAQTAGIKYVGWDYPQMGLVCTVAHEKPHDGIAHEYFLPSGPFAILPLTGNRSSLVWTEKRDIAQAALALGDAGFAREVRKRFGAFLGETEIVGPRYGYPLTLAIAREMYRERLALVGDAAHAIHPIAGQGFNLGLKDSAALAQVLAEAARRGEDIGTAAVLKRYAQWRQFDNALMAAATDGVNRLFSNDLAPIRAARSIGLSMVSRMGPARRFFMKQAAGLAGERPALLRGETI